MSRSIPLAWKLRPSPGAVESEDESIKARSTLMLKARVVHVQNVSSSHHNIYEGILTKEELIQNM